MPERTLSCGKGTERRQRGTHIGHVPQDLDDVVGQIPGGSAFKVPPVVGVGVHQQVGVLKPQRADHFAAVRAFRLHL